MMFHYNYYKVCTIVPEMVAVIFWCIRMMKYDMMESIFIIMLWYALSIFISVLYIRLNIYGYKKCYCFLFYSRHVRILQAVFWWKYVIQSRKKLSLEPKAIMVSSLLGILLVPEQMTWGRKYKGVGNTYLQLCILKLPWFWF